MLSITGSANRNSIAISRPQRGGCSDRILKSPDGACWHVRMLDVDVSCTASAQVSGWQMYLLHCRSHPAYDAAGLSYPSTRMGQQVWWHLQVQSRWPIHHSGVRPTVGAADSWQGSRQLTAQVGRVTGGSNPLTAVLVPHISADLKYNSPQCS